MSKIKGKKRKAVKNTTPILKPKTRKDIRKEKRQMKKLKKQEYFSKGKNDGLGKYVMAPKPDSSGDEEETELVKPLKTKGNIPDKSKENIIVQENIGAKKREQKLKEEMKETRNCQLLKANEEEDKIIKKLEKQLKLKKKSGVAKSFAEDGLGYLLEVCDEKTMSAAVTAEKHMLETGSGSDFEEDFAIATGKNVDIKNQKKQLPKSSQESDESDVDGSLCDDDSLLEELNHDSEMEDSEDEMMDDLEEEELMEEEEEEEDEEHLLSYGGMSGFPDDSFKPGNLSPVKEETDQELNSYMNNSNEINTSARKDFKVSKSTSKDIVDSDEEHAVNDKKTMFNSDSDESMDSEMYNSEEEEEETFESLDNSLNSDYESDESESCSHEDDSEKEQVIVNGKVINTYGRPPPSDEEPEIERCPQLDAILANISDSENESQPKLKSSHTTDGVAKKESRKRKSKDSENSVSKKSKMDCGAKDEKLEMKKEKQSKVSNCAVKSKKSKLVAMDSDDDDDEDIDSSLDYSGSSMEEETLSDLEEEEKKNKCNEDGSWEDIYGRKRDKDGNVINETSGKYVPPHLREKTNDEESAEVLRLKRQIKGLLNKVAGSNMHWTSTQMETIYSSNSRNAVNSAFCSLWLSALVQPTVTPDRMAAEHAMLVAILHANVGSEVGAHFLQTVIKKFDALMKTSDQLCNDKELDNLILAISQLYNFKIFQASLLYEVLTVLLEKLTEKSVECTLVALRNVGGALRKDDPAALKNFIHCTQEKAVSFKQGTSDGSRVKFLLDVLMAIKNNNMNKIPNYDPTYADELKKSLKGIIRRGNYVVPLNIKLDDLLNADKKGKWWVVGSAWEGNTAPEKEEQKIGNKESDKNQAFLMELAKKQRINTELRRSIFFIIMSAEDHMDCFEKLQQLGLKNQQEKEIIHVLLSCCLQEKTYNPYYAILAQKFCDYDRKFQLSIQFSVWDKLKEIDTCPTFQIVNLAQFLTHLFNEKGLPLSILKVVEFSDLSKSTLRLMRQILLAVLLQKNSQTCLEVFQRVAVSPKLHMFREGLRLFISHFLLKNSDKKENVLDEEQMTLLKERAAAVDKTLSSDSKLRF